MTKRIEKVAVLGAGTMGARISAHLANAGVPSYLLDIVPPDADGPVRNRFADPVEIASSWGNWTGTCCMSMHSSGALAPGVERS